MTLLKAPSLEKLSNLAVLAVAAVVIFSFLWRDFRTPTPPSADFRASSVPLGSITRNPSKVNVVLGVSTTCHFCEQNIDFYKRLSASVSPGQVAFYTVFPQTREEAGSYLDQKGIHPTGMISSPLSTYSIRGTPTLLLVGSDGKVEGSWVGALDATRQAEVLKRIHQND